MMSYRLGVDIGGTFTDFALYDEQSGELAIHKQLTTPDDPSRAVLEGSVALLLREGVDIGVVREIVHGTTLVTNSVIERKGPRTGLLTTKGFRDILDMRQEKRYDVFDLRLAFPDPIVPRRMRGEVTERCHYDGRVELPLDLDGARNELAHLVEEHQIKSLSICLLHSYANPTHEQALARMAREEFPGLAVSLSSEVCPEWREFERFSTTTINAYTQPMFDEYLGRLEIGLKNSGFIGQFFVMSSSGGTLTPETARRFPVRVIESGPAAGVQMSAFHGRELDLGPVLSFDMGGTTAKGALIRDGRAIKEYHQEVARVHGFKAGSGLPVKAPVIDMIEIGAGGGSIAAPDVRGAIAVGPQSAGAEPGPACYGQGGSHATLTDANLSLGFLDPDFFLGGEMGLDKVSATEAINRTVGSPLELPHDRAAWGIHEVINEDVARAFRIHASERGFDYRNSTMIAFGGSGPVHAMGVARKLGIPRVIFPFAAGVMSALGLLASPLTFEVSRTRQVFVDQVDADDFQQTFKSLEEEAQDPLRRAASEAEVKILRRLDMRYHGQGHEIEVEVPLRVELENLPDLFRETYKSVYGASLLDAPLVITTWKVEAALPTPSLLTIPPTAVGEVVKKGQRLAYFDTGFVETPVYDRYQLAVDTVILGPALIEERESTVVLGPGDRAQVDRYGNLVAEWEKAP